MSVRQTHTPAPDYQGVKFQEARFSAELQPAVKIFFESEAKSLAAYFESLAITDPLIKKWADEIVSRVANPIARIMRLQECDLPRLDESIRLARHASREVSHESIKQEIAEAGESAGELGSMLPKIFSSHQACIQIAEQRALKGRELLQAVDPFLAQVCINANEIESSPRRAALKLGFFVSQDYHRSAIFKRSLPSDVSANKVAELLGGDLSWIVRVLADKQFNKAEIVRNFKRLKERSNIESIGAETLEVHYPEPLGTERMTAMELVDKVLTGSTSSSLASKFAEEIELYFTRRAEKVLKTVVIR